MRWERLFADLAAFADAIDQSERAGEIEERTRLEFGSLELRHRLLATLETRLAICTEDGAWHSGAVRRVGVDWVLLEESAGREVVILLGAVVSVRGVGRAVAVPSSLGVVDSRLTLRTALRGMARDRLPVRAHLRGGGVIDATVDRVGADYVEVATHPAGEVRRRGEVRHLVVIPLSALVAVQRVV